MNRRRNIVRKQRSTVGIKQRQFKIVVTGPFSAGKTTLIQTVSEVAVVGTERDVTDETRGIKERTTVAMDFGRITFPDGLTLFVFGTPGQRRFEVMWEILSEGMLGFIVLVHAADDRSVQEAAHILATFRELSNAPYVVGVTHLDQTPKHTEEVFAQVRQVLELPEHVQVIAADPRRKRDAKALMLVILSEVLARLEHDAKAV